MSDITAGLGAPSSDELFRFIVESAEDYAVLATDADGCIISWNAGAQRIFGYSEAEILGRPADVLYTPEDRAAGIPAQELQMAREQGRARDERWHLHKDGSRFWVQGMVRPLLDDNHELRGFVKVARNMTATLQAEQALHRSEEQFRLLVNSVKNYAIFLLDSEGRVETWNAGCERVKGWQEKDVVGKYYALFHTEEDQLAGKPYLNLQIAEAQGHLECEDWRVRSDGTRFMAQISLSPVRDSAGNLRGFAKVLKDITGRKQAEAERATLLECEKKARQEAEHATRVKNDFLATVSHELRTPLSSILGWSQLIRSGALDEETVRGGLDTIERSGRALAQLVDDLLDVSRIITGKLNLNLETVEPASVIQEACNAARPAAQEKGVQLQLLLDPDVDCVACDPARLQQVVRNLLSNAIKFTPKDGRVEVRVQPGELGVEIKVSDNGQGISAQFLPHMFDRFRQADQAITRAHGGLGLGLAIVRELVEMQGGTVRAESDGEGLGSTFTVNLPRGQQGVAAPRTNGEQRSADVRDLRVLAIEDDDDTRELLVTILTLRGARVLPTCCVEDGIRALEREKPDVVLCDIGMPGEDGYSFVRRLRDLGPERGGDIPAVALTAFARDEERTRALEAGFDVHLAKPIQPTVLLETVSRLAGRGMQ